MARQIEKLSLISPQVNILVDDFAAINAVRHKSGAGQHQDQVQFQSLHKFIAISHRFAWHYETAPISRFEGKKDAFQSFHQIR